MKSVEYTPGQLVPVSGLYAVLHDPKHGEAHEVTCVAGEPFPPCHGCGAHPRYRLVRPARHVTHWPRDALVLFFGRS